MSILSSPDRSETYSLKPFEPVWALSFTFLTSISSTNSLRVKNQSWNAIVKIRKSYFKHLQWIYCDDYKIPDTRLFTFPNGRNCEFQVDYLLDIFYQSSLKVFSFWFLATELSCYSISTLSEDERGFFCRRLDSMLSEHLVKVAKSWYILSAFTKFGIYETSVGSLCVQIPDNIESFTTRHIQ